jgi:GntR family negative regulator for fad regulon and positive regulator of fabA
MAAKNNPEEIVLFLNGLPAISDPPEEYSEYDFNLHLKLTQASGNPIFTLILNGFKELFKQKAMIYFQDERARIYSHNFYNDLHKAFVDHNPERVFEITEKVMKDSISFWKNTN